MKTLSRAFAFILLAIIAIFAFVSCHSKFATSYKYDEPVGNPNQNHLHYRTFKKGDDDDSDFSKKLANPLKARGGKCEITILNSGLHQTPQPYCKYCECHKSVNLKTDRVIKSKTANKTAAGQPAANDPNVTWHVMSNYQADIDEVLNTLNP